MVAGPQYPDTIKWPTNVDRLEHLAPSEHRRFYSQQRFTLNLTRGGHDQGRLFAQRGLFEAAACGAPIISDRCPGIENFFVPGREILLAEGAKDVLGFLTEVSEQESGDIASRALKRVLRDHTSARRAQQRRNPSTSRTLEGERREPH